MSADPDNMTEAEIQQMHESAAAWLAKYRADTAGSFYAVRAGDFVKVGFTKGNAAVRVAKLQTGCPLPLELIAVGYGGRRIEQSLHDLFRRFDAHVHGEWFRATPLVLETIQKFCAVRH